MVFYYELCGRMFKLKGKGMPLPKGAGFGDLFVVVHIAVPTKLTQKQRELVSGITALYKENVRENLIKWGQHGKE